MVLKCFLLPSLKIGMIWNFVCRFCPLKFQFHGKFFFIFFFFLIELMKVCFITGELHP